MPTKSSPQSSETSEKCNSPSFRKAKFCSGSGGSFADNNHSEFSINISPVIGFRSEFIKSRTTPLVKNASSQPSLSKSARRTDQVQSVLASPVR